jgi:transcriptional regulator with XRE-family HTH domain
LAAGQANCGKAGEIMGSFANLGQALRWLRTRQNRKQYEIAESAGITKAMLSSYETGKQSPSIETLEKILDALHVDLADLHYSLMMHQSSGRRPELESGSEAWHAYERERMHSYLGEPRVNVYRVLEIDHPLPPEQERAMTEMLHGFHSLVRHMYNTLRRSTRGYGARTSPSTTCAPSAPATTARAAVAAVRAKRGRRRHRRASRRQGARARGTRTTRSRAGGTGRLGAVHGLDSSLWKIRATKGLVAELAAPGTRLPVRRPASARASSSSGPPTPRPTCRSRSRRWPPRSPPGGGC